MVKWERSALADQGPRLSSCLHASTVRQERKTNKQKNRASKNINMKRGREKSPVVLDGGRDADSLIKKHINATITSYINVPM